ncbi:MAG TPA: methyltetrahydrofolate cobalamin methyltransferase [Bacillota bacterium]|jgi:5-methyltetrahydrofolate--homocysteine methyltransferase|nr:methyltetrahydrofolate cobalamin methyltransferase [Bacillota bacterium]
MIFVGERINTSRKGIASLVEARDEQRIVEMAREQKDAGATFVDVNCGTLLDAEAESLEWMVKTIQGVVDTPLSLDSPNPVALRKALAAHKGKALVNSISLEKDRLEAILPLIQEYGCATVALAMDDTGIPETVDDRVDIASRLTEKLLGSGMAVEDIFLDPLVRPISTGGENGTIVLETIRRIHQSYPGIHTIIGLSNISFGLPGRRLLNRAFLLLAMEAGLNAAILDPLDATMMSLVQAGQALLGKDEYCLEYISSFRAGKLQID